MADMKMSVFLAALSDSNLLDEAQRDTLAKDPLTQGEDSKVLARELVNRKLLTTFQASQVLAGQGKSLVVGPYRLLERIGEGGMGQVYKAQHQTMNRIVALKVMRKDKLANPGSVQRFYREIQAAAQVVHPHIVIAFDADQVDGTHFFAMEYVDGSDLSQLVKQSGPLPIAQACDYVRQAALGLQHAHTCGLVHRDIKPANLLVGKAGGSERPTVKILDMGLARLQEGHDQQQTNLTRVGTVLGTPEYMAPEQAVNSSTVDIRADLYSLGCTLFYLLTGQAPFRGNSIMEVLLKHREDPRPTLSNYRPDAPAKLQEVLDKLLAKKVDDRFATPGELVSAIEPFCPSDARAGPAWIAPPEMRTKLAGIDFGPKDTAPAMAAATACVDATPAKTLPSAPKADSDSKSRAKARLKRRETQKRNQRLKIAGIVAVVAAVIVAGMVYSQLGKPKSGAPAQGDQGESEFAQLIPKDDLAASAATDPKPDTVVPTPEKVEPKPAPKTEPIPESKPELKPEPKPEPKPESKPETKPEPKPETKPEPKPEPRPEPRPAPKIAKKTPAPALPAQLDFVDKLKEENKAGYASKRPAEQLELANTFLKQAEAAAAKPLERFVLLREASELAALSGNAEPALEAIDKLDNDYDINELDLRARVLEKAIKAATVPATLKPIMDQGRELAEEAIAADQYDLAVKLLAAAEKAAYGLRQSPVANQISVRKREVTDMVEDYKEVKKANEVLAKNPEDAKASLTVGKFLCLHKGNWGDGLPLVVEGSDATLKTLAEKDLDEPEPQLERVKLGDSWYALGEKEKRIGVKKQLFTRARHWYELAGELPEKLKSAVDAKQKAMDKVLPREEAVAAEAPKETPVVTPARPTTNPEFDKKMKAGQTMLAQNKYGEAVEFLSEALPLAPDKKNEYKVSTLLAYATHMEKGVSMLSFNRPRDAVDEFQSALQVFPSNPAAINGLQIALSRSGRGGNGNGPGMFKKKNNN